MSDSIMSAEECREATRKLFGDEIDYSYITDELIAADAKLGDEVIMEKSAEFTEYYGNNPRSQNRVVNGVSVPGTLLDYDGNGHYSSEACGSRSSGWFNANIFVQEFQGTCPNGKFKFRMW